MNFFGRNKFSLGPLILFSVFIFCGCSSPEILPPEKKENRLEISTEIFYRQTFNNCGPYSVMAAVNILTGEKKDPELLARKIKFRIQKNLTLPQGVVKLLHDNKIRTKEFSLKKYSDEEKICWLKNQIDSGMPVILLIKWHGVLHYVTVLGYDRKGFMLYDSMQDKDPSDPRKTVADNSYAGNRFYSYGSLMMMWNESGYKGLYKDYAIVCGK